MTQGGLHVSRRSTIKASLGTANILKRLNSMPAARLVSVTSGGLRHLPGD
jgi:hypothetical protein